jgi:hypothetical protein
VVETIYDRPPVSWNAIAELIAGNTSDLVAGRASGSAMHSLPPSRLKDRLDTSRLLLIKLCSVKDGFPGTSATDRLWRAPCKSGVFPVGESPTRQLSLQPEAIGAVMEVTKWLKPLM